MVHSLTGFSPLQGYKVDPLNSLIFSLCMQDKLAQIRQLLVDLGVSEYGGVNCLSRLGHIIGRNLTTSHENTT